MSTIALDYPNSLPLRRTSNVQCIVALVASVILVAASASAKVDFSSGIIAIPVPIVPAADAYIMPSTIVTPAPNPVAIAVPVPEPPAP